MTAGKLLALVCSAAAASGCARRALTPDAGAGTIGLDGSAGGVDGSTRGPPQNAATWSAWPLVNHDAANTRRSPNVGPQAPFERLVFDVGAQALVIGDDGTLYATDRSSVRALDPNTGAQLWSFSPTPPATTTVAPFFPEIAAGPEGNLYVAYQQGGFYALDRAGAVRWWFTTGRTIPSGDASDFRNPLVDSAGRVYVGERSIVYAFESDGRTAWQLDTKAERDAYPSALAADGSLYVTEEYGSLDAVDRAGAIRWTLPRTPSVPFLSIPIVRGDGSLLLPLLGDKQFGVVDAGGSIVWQKPGELGFVLGADDGPYAVDGTGVLRLRRDGSVAWQSLAGGHGALVDGAGTIYCSSYGTIDAIDANGIVKWEMRAVDPAVPGSAAATPAMLAIGGDGTLYVSYGGRIHAIGGGGRCEGAPVDCDDRDPCTIDRCDPAAGCVHEPKCVSRDSCTTASCAADGACTFEDVLIQTPCDDGIACSQFDACQHGVCTATASTCGLDGAWPAAGYDQRHTRAGLPGPSTPTVTWSSPGPAVSTFVIADDGTLFATGGGAVRAISPDGIESPFAAVAATDLVLRKDGLYATEQPSAGLLHSFDATGVEQWTFQTTAPLSPPVISSVGAIYAATRFELLALAPDGSTRWRLPTGGNGTTEPPAVGINGTVYVLGPDLWAINPDGRVKWKRPVGWATGLLVGVTGEVYVLLDGGVRAIDFAGADRWTWSLGTSARFAAALGGSGGPLILTAGPTVYKLNLSDGTLISSLTPPAPARTVQQLMPPVIDSTGRVYVIANAEDSDSFQPLTQATVYAIDSHNQVLWSVPFPRVVGGSGANLALGPGNRLYLTVGGKLQAIGP
jgi:outer membrane protein assembly factor BamB